MHTIFQTCAPRAEVLRGELRDDIFAARLKDVIVGKADAVYQEPSIFFDNTYPTAGLKLLLAEALGRLSGVKAANNAIIRLETAFGGGKTHNLIALYHAATGYAPGDTFVDATVVPAPSTVQVVGVVGSDLQPRDGLKHEADKVMTYTLWGELAYQLGGAAGYARVANSDREYSAPGTGILEELVGDKPTLIMLDEIARHMRAAKTVPTATGKSDLAEQTVAFLMSLLEFAASCARVVVVLTLAEAQDSFGRETEKVQAELAEAQRVSARQERVITPTGETEIAHIVTHRLFKTVQRDAVPQVVQQYQHYYNQLIAQDVDLPQRATWSDYATEMTLSYPFHPELLNTLNRKTSTIPNFQKTRGALRLLAEVIRRLWETEPADTFLIHPFHLDLSVAAIATDLTSRLDRPNFGRVIEADIVSSKSGSPAHAQLIDAPWVEAGKPPYTHRVATAAFLHSLCQGIATGVDPADLKLAALVPGDDPALLHKALTRLVESGWFFDWDSHRYRFKTEPSLNKIVEDEKTLVGRARAKTELDRRIGKVWKEGFLKVVLFASEAREVDDDADKPKLVIMHYDAVTTTLSTADGTVPPPPDLVQRIFNYTGTQEKYRTYKNNVLFLVADKEQVDNMVEIARRYLAIGRIVGDAARLGEFHEEQRKRLKKMAEATELEVRVAITKAYRYFYYPSADAPTEHSHLAREPLPPQDQGEVNQDQTAVILRVLKQLQKTLTSDDAVKPAAYIKAKAWDAGKTMLSTEDLRRAFARRMNLQILLNMNQLKKTIRNGINQQVWIYYDTVEGKGYDHESPSPNVQVSEDALLYTLAEAARLNLIVKGKEPPSPPGGDGTSSGDPVEKECPVCHYPVSQCICGAGGGAPGGKVRLHAAGAPAQAFQGIRDQCADHEIDRVQQLRLYLEGTGRAGAAEARSLGLAIPQLGKGEYYLEQNFGAEFSAAETVSVKFTGGWDRYKRLKQVTDEFGKEADKLLVKTTLRIDYDAGLAIDSEQFQSIADVFATLNFGKIIIDAEPFEPTE